MTHMTSTAAQGSRQLLAHSVQLMVAWAFLLYGAQYCNSKRCRRGAEDVTHDIALICSILQVKRVQDVALAFFSFKGSRGVSIAGDAQALASVVPELQNDLHVLNKLRTF